MCVRILVCALLLCTLIPSSPIPAYAHIRDRETVITLSAVGDCTLGYDERFAYKGSYADYYNRNAPDYFFSNVAHIFAEDDLTIANCEGVLADRELAGEPDEKQFIHRGDGAYAEIFRLGNVDAVNLANNHTFDFFKPGFNETRRNLTEHGVGYFGRGYIFQKRIKGIRVALLGYSGYTNGYKSTAKKDIAHLREAGVDLIIVSFHWGEMHTYYPTELQLELGHFAVDNGADLVLGHHPHVIQGVELYKGKYIVYSLGNFSYGGSKNPADKDTFIFRQKFTFIKGELSGEPEIEIIPARITSAGKYNDYCPTPAYGAEAARIHHRMLRYSKPFNTSLPLQVAPMKEFTVLPE